MKDPTHVLPEWACLEQQDSKARQVALEEEERSISHQAARRERAVGGIASNFFRLVLLTPIVGFFLFRESEMIQIAWATVFIIAGFSAVAIAFWSAALKNLRRAHRNFHGKPIRRSRRRVSKQWRGNSFNNQIQVALALLFSSASICTTWLAVQLLFGGLWPLALFLGPWSIGAFFIARTLLRGDVNVSDIFQQRN